MLWLWFLAGLCAVAAVQSALLILQWAENLRFVRRRRSDRRAPLAGQYVVLLAPCKGNEPGLRDNLRRLFLQEHWPYEIRFVVESPEDAACPVIRALQSEFRRVPSRLVIAGRSEQSGQKIHNLLCGLEGLPSETQIVAFVDSDARPDPHWLGTLIRRLEKSNVGAVSGYRCLTPLRITLANLVVYGLNSFVVAMFGAGGRHAIWGGSWALRLDLLDRLDLRRAWRGRLTEDLIATRVLLGAGLRIEYEPRCLVDSPFDFSWSQAAEFVRRQYLQTRVYLRSTWLLGFITATISTAGFWGAAVSAGIGVAISADWTWLPAMGCGLLYAATVARNLVGQRLIRTCRPGGAATNPAARWFAILAGPVVGLANWLALCSSAFGRTLTWRGVTYHLGRDGTVAWLRRPERCDDRSTVSPRRAAA
jgi:hypothetical protein